MGTVKKETENECVTKKEQVKKLWQKRITDNSTLSSECAKWMVNRIDALLNYMQYGYALIAYRKQNGDFYLGRSTLIYYEQDFKQKYDVGNIKSHIVYWDAEQQGWRTFMIENFLEWKPIVN